MTGQPTHNTDWLDPLDEDTVVFTHCGSGSFSLAEKSEDIQLASVRLMGQGVCALFPARPGPVTLVNIVPGDSDTKWPCWKARPFRRPWCFPGNPLRVRFGCPVADIDRLDPDEGIGHHWMAGYGHLGDDIRQWTRIAGGGVRLLIR